MRLLTPNEDVVLRAACAKVHTPLPFWMPVIEIIRALVAAGRLCREDYSYGVLFLPTPAGKLALQLMDGIRSGVLST